MNWTEEQRATIETIGKNILVSAAAGSGKTTVLVERIKNLVLNKGADIDRFLITTFTKAAATEMKMRLEKAIRDEMKKPDADRTRLLEQLQKLPSANISTFHAFAIEIIRQYFYLTDLEPGFAVGDEIRVGIMRSEALDEVFRRRYEEEYDEFSDFLLKYSSPNSDRRLKDNILDTCKTLASIPDYMDHVKAKAELLNTESPLKTLDGYAFMVKKLQQGLAEAASCYEKAAELYNDSSTPGLYAKATDDAETIEAIAAAAGAIRGENLKEKLTSFGEVAFEFTLNRMQVKGEQPDDETKKAVKRYRDAGRDKIGKIKKDIFGTSFDELDQDMKDVYRYTAYYIGLIEEFLATFKRKKSEAGLVDFDDIMHYAIDILKSDDVAAELRERFRYIFIDEYQDSNYLQEVIVGRISGEDNLFMVGDVKQCIYKFRLAEPELFREKQTSYALDSEENSLLLNLNSNFRSKRSVTDAVNAVFAKVMDGYDENARLHCTAPEEYSGIPARIHLVNKEELNEDIDKSEAEAAIVADIIRERLGTEIFDAKAGKTRRAELRDFAVIARNNNTVEGVERYLNNEGIDAYGEVSGNYYETVEVRVFMNILMSIDNMRLDVPLISTMKSVVFGFAAGELAEIRINHREGTFYNAVVEYAESGENDELRGKVCRMIDDLRLWKEISRTVPLSELVRKVMYETGYYDYCSGLPVGNRRISNLRLIVDKAGAFETMSYGGLYGFLKYVEAMNSGNESDGEAKTISESDDVVRIMSVHKSKGLEFPIVIFVNASKQTRSQAGNFPINIHRDLGIGLQKVNREEHWYRRTFLQKLIDDRKESEKVEEEIRILYVALTRAKDCLEIVGTVKAEDKLPDTVSTNTFLDMMYLPMVEADLAEVLMYDEAGRLKKESESDADATSKPAGLVITADKEVNPELKALIDYRLGYQYQSAEGAAGRPKYSVSALNRLQSENDIAAQFQVAEFKWEQDRKATTAADMGTTMHFMMEKIDFAKAATGGRKYVQELADTLLAEQTITAEQYDSINIDNLAAFFESDIGRRAAEAYSKGKLLREKEFIMTKEVEDSDAIVQGIIDCCFEENGQYILIDYKNSSLAGGRTPEDVASSYAQQIALYRDALEGAGMPVKEAYIYLFTAGKFVLL